MEGAQMHYSNRLAALLAIALLAMSAGPARAEAPRVEFTPFAGYRVGGKFEIEDPASTTRQSVNLNDGASFGLDVGLYRDPTGFYEVLYSQQQAGLNSHDPALKGLDVKVEYLHFGGTALFQQEAEWLVPYLSLTIGATKLAAQGGHYDSATKFSASVGGGLRLPINEHLDANFGMRGYFTLVSSNTGFLCVSNSDGANCLLRSTGSGFFQGEALLGLTLRF
jgi:hypothetical protein